MKSSGPGPKRNVYLMEFAGTRIEVLDHTDPTLIGVKGVVIRETMGTFVIRMEGKEKMVQKKGGIFKVDAGDGKGLDPAMVLGDDIIYRPVDRTKKCERKKPPASSDDMISRS